MFSFIFVHTSSVSWATSKLIISYNFCCSSSRCSTLACSDALNIVSCSFLQTRDICSNKSSWNWCRNWFRRIRTCAIIHLGRSNLGFILVVYLIYNFQLGLVSSEIVKGNVWFLVWSGTSGATSTRTTIIVRTSTAIGCARWWLLTKCIIYISSSFAS